MSFVQELRKRRVPQYTSGYLVLSWGLIQVVAFLEERMLFSPHLVNVIGLALILLLPSVIVVAWCHGRPGPDLWTRAAKWTVPANMLVAAALILVLFQGKDLGAMTATVSVQDENGETIDRVVPKSDYLQRVVIYYFDNRGDDSDDWLREATSTLLVVDISQDIFVDCTFPPLLVPQLQTHGHPDGHGLPRSLQRKLARDAHYKYYVTGWCERTGDQFQLGVELYEAENSKRVTERIHEGPDLFRLVDAASVQLRQDLEIPVGHLETSSDLPVADITTNDLDAFKAYIHSLIDITHNNDWAAAAENIQPALERDPGFTLGNFVAYGIYTAMGRTAEAQQAIETAINNVYRVPERTQFTIKSVYYFNVKQDADKALAILKMWSQLYPTDVAAYKQQALYYTYRNDLPAAITALETALELDPSQHDLLMQIGEMYVGLGEFDRAATYFDRYASRFPSDVQAQVKLAELHRDAGNFDRMREVLEKAQILELDHTDIELLVADLEIKLGNFAEAQALYTSLLDRDLPPRERLEVLDGAQDLAIVKGQIRAAERFGNDWIETASQVYSPPEVQIVEGIHLEILSQTGRHEEALAGLEALIQRATSPVDQFLANMKAQVLAEMGRFDEALPQLAAAHAIVEQFKLELWRPRLNETEATIAAAQGNLAEALDRYRACIEQKPASRYYRCLAASILRRQGELEQAADMLQSASALFPSHPSTRLELALLARDAGRPDQTREHLQHALAVWSEADEGHVKAAEARALAADLNLTF